MAEQPFDVALARNAFDVAMRRGWGVVQVGGQWCAYDYEQRCHALFIPSTKLYGGKSQYCPYYPDPFTALVESDEWYKEHVDHG